MTNEMEGSKFDRQTDRQSLVYNKQNPWISLLRIFMCFVVIREHFTPVGDTMVQKIVGQFGSIAVPCFMFLSFFFMSGDIKLLKFEKIKSRILRLYIPIFFWNIIYWSVKNIIFIIFNKKDAIIGINGLIEGLLFTHYHGLPAQLWFLFSQIIILVFVCICLSYINSDKWKNIILTLMLILAISIEYLGVNNDLFESSVYAVRYPFGRVIECIPYAVIGILFAWNLKEKKVKIKLWFLAISIMLAFISWAFIPTPAGFGYGGAYLLFSSTAICVFAFILPDFIHGRIRYAINYIGSCTMGVYCLHVLIGWMIEVASSQINLLDNILYKGTLIYDFVIFIMCLIITLFIRGINKKLNWKWIEYIA